jgi:hypothetical protein
LVSRIRGVWRIPTVALNLVFGRKPQAEEI